MPNFVSAPAKPESIITGENWRITVLTPCLLRLEWDRNNQFFDAQTQVVVNRDFPTPEFSVQRVGKGIRLSTESLLLEYDGEAFSSQGLFVKLKSKAGVVYGSQWRFGDPTPVDSHFGNLGGTARTLDMANGEIPLEPGMLSRAGFSILDDSHSLGITVDGWVAPRQEFFAQASQQASQQTGQANEPVAPPAITSANPSVTPSASPSGHHDLYFFGYGNDFHRTLADYFVLTGASPLIPRFALGNWWSRFWHYSEDEYLQLMSRFQKEGVPLSVAVLDMDWHLVDVDPAIGSGWTGYTWNHDLFPDPQRFLAQLHAQNLAVTLNVHPADGIRRHEQQYREVAKYVGQNPDTGEPVDFNIASQRFMQAYFNLVHHQLEDQGVDFWWIDWQQGDTSAQKGLDPLWMLNFLHYRDSQRQIDARPFKQPLILSRYSGPGSHRFPLGFSGDTFNNWESLEFQPYFTSTAANIGYFWWSHDIGGHGFASRDFELSTRWLQFGVFSPINRLHSTMSPFLGKEPWAFPQPYREVQKNYLRLRHALIPYLYTQMWRSHQDSVAPIRPIYHDYPDRWQAYKFRNSYFYGDLLVAPITNRANPSVHLAKTTAWIPDGTWQDLFTGYTYHGPALQAFYRPLGQLPVLVPQGRIIPLAPPEIGANPHPETLALWVYLDENNQAYGRIIEEIGNMFAGDAPACLDIHATFHDGNLDLNFQADNLPPQFAKRKIVVYLPQLAGEGGVATSLPPSEFSYQPLCYQVEAVNVSGATVSFYNLRHESRAPQDAAFALLDNAECRIADKETIWNLVQRHSWDGWRNLPRFSAELLSEDIDPTLQAAVHECVLGTIGV